MANIDYIISIGGSGAKCVQAFIHCIAAGMLEEDHQIKLLYVDVDQHNGNLRKARQTKEKYNQFYKTQMGKSTPFGRASVEYVGFNKGVWSPRYNENQNTIEEEFSFNFTESLETRQLSNVLFTNEEKSLNVEEGFRGQPAIASLYLSKSIDLDKAPWRQLFGEESSYIKELEADNTVRIFLIGSVMGGIGAAGISVISQTLHNRYKDNPNFKIGAVIMLPYFGFNSGNVETLHAQAYKFSARAKYTLDYYQQQRQKNEVFNACYYIGDELYQYNKFSIGGKSQSNPPLPAELMGAMALIHGFKQENNKDPYHAVISRLNKQDKNVLSWDNLLIKNIKINYGFDELSPAKCLASLTRFAWLYNKLFYNTINNKKDKHNWCVSNQFKNSIQSTQIHAIKDYCDIVLNWLKSMKNVNLLNWEKETEIKKANILKKEVLDWSEILTAIVDEEFVFSKNMTISSLDKVLNINKIKTNINEFYQTMYEKCKVDINACSNEEKGIIKQWLPWQPQISNLQIENKPENVNIVEINESSVHLISDAMNTIYDINHRDNLQAIPNIWGRYIYFKNIMKETKKSEIRANLIGEWRGLMAILALRDLYDFKIAFKACDLSKREFNSKTIMFYESVYKLFFQELNNNSQCSSVIYFIEYTNNNNQTSIIGLLTPFSLVANCQNLKLGALDGIKWVKDDRLQDPCKYLDNRQKNSLYLWLDKCGRILEDNVSSDTILIKNQVNEYMVNLKLKDNNKKQEIILTNSKTNHFSVDNLQLFYVKPFSVTIQQKITNESQLLFSMPNDSTCVVLSQTGIFNQNSSKINIAGVYTLEDYYKNPINIKEKIEKIVPVIDLDDVFLDNIYYIENKNARKIAHHSMMVEKKDLMVLLPVKEKYRELLLNGFFNDIQLNLTDSKIILNLRIEYNTNQIIQTYVKEYDKKTQRIINNEIKNINIWPSCVLKPKNINEWTPWKCYYAHTEISDRIEQKVYQEDGEFGHERIYKKEKYYKLKSYPKAIEIKDKETKNVWGYYLIDEPVKMVNNKKIACKVGIDLGTTSTAIAIIESGNVRAETLSFGKTIEDTYVENIEFEQAELNDEINKNNYFLKQIRENKPIYYNIYQLFNEELENEPLINGRVVDISEWNELDSDKVHINFKQVQEHNEIEQAKKGFISQILLQTAWEVKKNGYSNMQLAIAVNQNFQHFEIIERIIEKMRKNNLTGIEINKNIVSREEATATMMYWQNELPNDATNKGIVNIDIGGKNTDISILFNPIGGGKYRNQSKLIDFAGERIYLDNYYYFINSKYIMNEINEIENLNDIICKKHKIRAIRSLEMALTFIDDQKLIVKHIIGRGDGQLELKKLYRCILFGVCGILYYTGLLINEINKKTGQIMKPYVCFSGNGSRIIEYLYGGEDLLCKQPVNDIFASVINAVVGTNCAGKIYNSMMPKSEVARGLIEENQLYIHNTNEDMAQLKYIDETIANVQDIKNLCEVLAKAYKEQFNEVFEINNIEFENIEQLYEIQQLDQGDTSFISAVDELLLLLQKLK